MNDQVPVPLRKILPLIAFVFIFLGGCGTTRKVISARATSPQNTPISSATPSCTPTPTPTVTTDDTATATPDWSEMRVNRQTYTSPDSKWIVEIISASPKDDSDEQVFYDGMNILNADGRRLWVIFDEWTGIGLGYSIPEFFNWSIDGKSFYYTDRVIPDGCTGAYNNGSDLYKVDLESGKVTEILPKRGPGWIALSPDEKTVAYDIPHGRGLVLRDAALGLERSVSIGNLERDKQYGVLIIWSPDSQSLGVTVANGACDMVEYGESTSVLVVEAATLTVRTIASEDKRYLVASTWLDDHRLALLDIHGTHWIWDALSGELVSILETQTPNP
jgi:hypothetical protein